MALTQVKTDGIANGAVTTQQLAPGAAGGPKITQIQITNSGGTVLDDTAVSTSGGYIKITGTGFAAGAQVIINNTPATSTTFTSTTVLNAQVGAQSAGTYVVYVVNTDGGVAIAVNGLTYSAEPAWVTSSTLPNGATDTPISIQLSATEATTYTLQAGSTLPSGLTLTSGGLLSGTVSNASETTYSFTIVATDAQAQDSPRTFSITITVGDPYFYLTTLLLPGNGTNNGTNNTFLDGSNNNFTITRTGNTTQGTFTPFSQTGWSNFFDGNGDTLSFADNAALEIGSGDFTFEAWVYLTAYSGTYGGSFYNSGICGKDNETTRSYNFGIIAPNASSYTGLAVGLFTGSTFVGTQANFNFQLNRWYHVAGARQSGTIRLFVDGVLIGSGTNTTSTNNGSQPFCVGAAGLYTGFEYFFPGYISNFRFVNGTAVYTTNFTPSIVPLTAIANTAVLTCQSNRFIDNSTNNFTITRNGDVTIQPSSPFNPSVTYTANAIGGSAYFDGSGDYLTYPADSSFWNDSSFTIELWAYCTKASGSATLVASWTDGNFSAGSWGVEVGTASVFTLSNGGSSTTNQGPWLSGTTNIRNNGWHHFCVTKSGTQYRLFTDGKFEAYRNESFTTTNNVPIKLGYQGDGTYQPESRVYSGWISGYRIIRNSIPAEYQTSLTTPGTQVFTPPTAPPTNVSGTTILMNFTNGQIIDVTAKNDLETLADAKISTAQSKWNGSSIYLDGTGDYLIMPYNRYGDFGTGDFTVEFWMRASAAGTYVSVIGTQSISGFSTAGIWRVSNRFNSNNGIYFNYTTGSAFADVTFTTTNYNDNAWHHVAVTRANGTLRAFVDGTQAGSNQTVTQNLSSGQKVAVGWNAQDSAFYTGYLQDVRITNGYARYTSNFTPPTGPFTLK